MSKANEDLLRRAWAAYDVGDVEAFAACLTDDWREYGPEGPAGWSVDLEHEIKVMEANRIAFSDKHTEIHHIVANDTMVGCNCTVTATHTGPYMGLEATGKTIIYYEMMFNIVRDGKLAETWAMTEGVGIYEQLTGRPAPE